MSWLVSAPLVDGMGAEQGHAWRRGIHCLPMAVRVFHASNCTRNPHVLDVYELVFEG
jgi:hypothetical protein